MGLHDRAREGGPGLRERGHGLHRAGGVSRTVWLRASLVTRPEARSVPFHPAATFAARSRNGSSTPSPTVARAAAISSRSGSRASWRRQAAAPSPAAWAWSRSTASSPARP
ncbi:hypothetical protein STENM327S_02339 [Streptomyces tendae]